MIIEDIRPNPAPTSSNVWNEIFRMSSVGGCDRALLAIQYDVPALGGGVNLAAEEGHLHEMDVVMRLRRIGYIIDNALDEQKEIHLTYGGKEWPNIIGHPDGNISGGNLPEKLHYVLEIKSMGAFVWPRLKAAIQEAFPVYYGQAQFYLHSEPDDVPAVLWIAKNRSSGELRELIIRRDPEYMDKRLAAISAALEAHKRGDEPQTMECSESEYTRKYCPYRYMCEGGFIRSDAPKQVVTDSAMQEAAELWRDGKAQESSGEAKIKQARLVLESTLKGQGLDKGIIEGLLCQMVSSGRTSWDMDQLLPHVPDDVQEAAKEVKSWTTLRVTDKET